MREKGGGIRRPWFPLLATDARSGASPSGEGAVEVKIKVKGNGQECPFHMGVASLR